MYTYTYTHTDTSSNGVIHYSPNAYTHKHAHPTAFGFTPCVKLFLFFCLCADSAKAHDRKRRRSLHIGGSAVARVLARGQPPRHTGTLSYQSMSFALPSPFSFQYNFQLMLLAYHQRGPCWRSISWAANKSIILLSSPLTVHPTGHASVRPCILSRMH